MDAISFARGVYAVTMFCAILNMSYSKISAQINSAEQEIHRRRLWGFNPF